MLQVHIIAKTNDIKENFSALLRDSLRSRFGRIPSAAVFAREFNLRAYDTSPISQESARRWLRGVSLPEEARLRVLVNWRNLNFNDALKPGRIHAYKPLAESAMAAPRNSENLPSKRAEVFTGSPKAEALQSLPNGSALSEKDAALLSAVFNLSEEQRVAILGLIGATLQPGHQPVHVAATLPATSSQVDTHHASTSANTPAESAGRGLPARP